MVPHALCMHVWVVCVYIHILCFIYIVLYYCIYLAWICIIYKIGTTHCSSQSEAKPTLVHKVPHHFETTAPNGIVKACPTILIHLKPPVSKEGQQVLDTFKGSTIGSKVEGSDWLLCTWLVSWVQCCIRLWVYTYHCWVWLTSALWSTSAPCAHSTFNTGRCPLLAAYITGVADYRRAITTI